MISTRQVSSLLLFSRFSICLCLTTVCYKYIYVHISLNSSSWSSQNLGFHQTWIVFSHYFLKYSLYPILSFFFFWNSHSAYDDLFSGVPQVLSPVFVFADHYVLPLWLYFCLFFHVFKHSKSLSCSFLQLYCYLKFSRCQPPCFLCLVIFFRADGFLM